MKKHLRFAATTFLLIFLSSAFFSMPATAGTPGAPPNGRATATEKFIKVNLFGGTNPYNNAAWNNWNVTASKTIAALQYSDATTSGVGAVISASTTVVDNGATYTAGTMMAPQEVLRYTSYAGTRTLTLNGLSANKTYNLELYGSRNATGNSTIFSAGGSSITIVTDKNFTNKALFTGLVPNASGQIVLNMTKVNTYTYLNGFMLTEVSNDPEPNQPPVVDAGADQALILPINTTSLNSVGTDPDGTIASYAWSQVSGPNTATLTNANAATVTASDLVQGMYVFRLIVTDNAGATNTDDVNVTVDGVSNQLLTANAGTDQTITLPANSASLSGSGTSTQGTITNYSWSQLSGPATATITDPQTAGTTVTGLEQGTYVFRLTITDDIGATATDDVSIAVNGANQPPAANAGTDQTISLPVNSTTLTGSGSDVDGSITGYSWSQVSGPTTATLTNATTSSATVSDLIQGVYVFQLTVTDNAGTTATDDIIVTVNAAPNQPPTVNAGADQTLTLPVNSTTITGTASDPDGAIATYSWSQTSGPNTATLTNATAATVTVSNLVQGTYVFRLTVTDNAGTTATDDISITANPANQPPVANAGTDKTITLPANSTSLSGSATDADGTITSYAWSQVSGPNTATFTNAATATVTVSNVVQGSYVFRLTATDNAGATAFDEVTVVVNPANQPPTANAGTDQTVTLPTSSTTLNGSGTDPDGTIALYAWTKVSGPTGGTITSPNTASTTITSLQQGIYVFRLTVTDNKGATTSDDINVVVNAAINQPPTANAGADKTITLPANSTSLSGSGSDPDGSITGYAWSQVSGPGTATLTNANAATVTASNLVQGMYVFRLMVTDNAGAKGNDDVNVTVNGTTVVKLGVFNPNDPVVTYDPAKPPVKPATGQVGKWVRTVRLSWNTTTYKCYIYNNMSFRLRFPKNYDSTRAYPLLLFLHGLGEYGTIYDNEYQLYHGGSTHASAVDAGKFDGFLLYPQSTTEQWSSGNLANIYNLIDKVMIGQGMVDPFRVYANGLSAGANNVWLFLRKYTKLVAAGTPISSASSSMLDSVQKYKYTPVYHFQGGLDTSPTPGAARSLGNNILKVGGNYTYKEFPDRGHACWYQAWGEADYFPFYARSHKANPWPLYGRTEFCQGETISDTLGVTAGFDGYEWRKDGTLIPGANLNYIVATAYGTYDCRIKRGTTWSPWSPTPVVIRQKTPTVQPAITITGLASNVIPAPDGRTSVPLEVPEGYQSYLWQKEGSTTTLSTTRFLTATTSGSYKVKVTEQYGCSASVLGFSAPFLVVNANGSNGPDAPGGLTATAVSKTAIKLTWNQTTSPAFNETGFEIYEATTSGGPYKYRGKTVADATTVTYSDLASGTAYFYKVRAVNNNAASAVAGPASATTLADNTAPSTPASLRLGTITKSSVELLWNASTDDVGVVYYDVYINGVKTYVVPGTLAKATMYNLIASKDYTFILKARDAAGNVSAASNQVAARTLTGTNTQDPTLSPANAANFSVYINLNVDNPASTPWNNTNSLPADSLVFGNLKNYSGNNSGISMTIVDNFTGYNAGGMNTGNNSGVYPDNVMRSAYYCDKGQVAKIQISGLSLNHKYSFVFFGSRSGTGDRTSVYKIGTQSVSLNAANNTTTTVQIDNVVPDQNGTVTYTVSLSAAALYAYQNSLVIKGYDLGTTTLTATAYNANAAVVEEPVPQDSAATLQAHPNPVTNDVMLTAPLQKAVPELVVQVYEPSGTLLSTRRFANLPQGSWQQRIPLTGRPGLYFVRISGLPDGKTQTIRLIKRK